MPPALPDPLERALWAWRPPALQEPPALPVIALPPVDQLVDRLLRRLALGGSRHRGTALLEVGAGSLQGATIVIHAEDARLRIEIETPDTEAARRWQQGVQAKLRERGFEAEILLR
ncbi:MAG: hypothetical protein MUF64_13160 [Polyangiaceae bacterium]|nr:hypothetical protein [Polyangiaceae bacterium]